MTRHVAEFGGSLQHGWTIWEWPGIYVEAEFHAVWKNPEGKLLDVSFKQDGERLILFLPDPTRVFNGRRVKHIRQVIGRSPCIKEWIQAQEEFQRYLTKTMRGKPFGTQIVLDDQGHQLQRRVQLLLLQVHQTREARRATNLL